MSGRLSKASKFNHQNVLSNSLYERLSGSISLIVNTEFLLYIFIITVFSPRKLQFNVHLCVGSHFTEHNVQPGV